MDKLPILVSYAFLRKQKKLQDKLKRNDVRLLVDSGAFTAFQKGMIIDIDEYCDFIKAFSCERYFMLDVIGDSKKTMDNLRYMYKKGLKPIPIFTRGADIKDVEEMYELSDLVAMGGIAIRGGNGPGYVKWCMENVIKGRKVHWLGWGDRDFLIQYKPRSYDIASVFFGSRFGSISVYKDGNIKRFDKEYFNSSTPRPEIFKACSELDFNVYDLKNQDEWSGMWKPNNVVTLAAYLKLFSDLYKKVGTIAYAVLITDQHLDIIIDTHGKLKSKGVI
jgi:hypothetical protein